MMKQLITTIVIFSLLMSISTLPTYAGTTTVAQPSPKEVVASCIVAEAGGEGYDGMYAVMCVIKTRAKGSTNINKYVDVVLKPAQFSIFNRLTTSQVHAKMKDHPKYAYALQLVHMAESDTLPDITGGSTHYHVYVGKNKVSPSWTAPSLGGSNKKALVMTKIGRHAFLKNVD